MSTLAVLHHLEEAAMGHAGPILSSAGVELDQRDLPRGDPLPTLGEVDGVLSLGGRQSIREIERYDYLGEELDLLAAAVDRDVPVLGVCLGGQLLARSLGAEVRELSERRIGWPVVERLGASEGDPVFGSLPESIPVLHWNQDYFEVPEGAEELLSRSGPGGEAIRVGDCAWGVQFHPEADPPLLDEWYRRSPAAPAAAGVTEARARAEDDDARVAQRRTAEALFGAFAQVVLRR